MSGVARRPAEKGSEELPSPSTGESARGGEGGGVAEQFRQRPTPNASSAILREMFDEAFRAWSTAGETLQKSYTDLQQQVARLREELIQKNQELALKARLASMGEMAARIAHELRNPLGSIELFASMLKQDLKDDPEKLRNAEYILRGVHNLNRIVSNLLLYTRFDAPRVRDCDLRAVLDDALEFTLMVSRKHGVDIQRDYAPGDHRMPVDPDLLRQVLTNLIFNALDAMPQGGRLTLGLAPCRNGSGQPRVQIRVEDTGLGMEAAVVGRIFDPFFTTKQGGMGLGLAIVKEIVDAHRGRIEVQSAPGQGTAFSIFLPAE
ncbi:MAG: hypothetical protein HYY13_06855 [Nitrospirae bacterium]|nr:hypothetical protein [Nitrospirota bacterium]